MPSVPLSVTIASFTWQWYIRSGNARMNCTGSTPCQIRWLGSKLKPNASRPSTASIARSAE